jgi:hypothetical protein
MKEKIIEFRKRNKNAKFRNTNTKILNRFFPREQNQTSRRILKSQESPLISLPKFSKKITSPPFMFCLK